MIARLPSLPSGLPRSPAAAPTHIRRVDLDPRHNRRVNDGLDVDSLSQAAAALAAVDASLARIVDRHGLPPLWPRDPGFETLVRIILEQQISLASAEAAYRRLESAAGSVSPGAILALGEEGARSAGQTRQKARYVVELARAVQEGRLDLEVVHHAPDDAARAMLTAIPGFGRWSADVYLLLALRRPDVWPAGDLALAGSVRHALGLDIRPSPAEMETLAEPWRPWRAVAARILWHGYLSGDRPRRRPTISP